MEKKLLAIWILMLFTIMLSATFALSDDVPMITKEQLKAMLGNPDCNILDFRHFSDYTSSDLKIKGAIREVAMGWGTGGWAGQYSKEKTLVLYCSSLNEVVCISTVRDLIKIHGFTKAYVLKGGWEEWLKAGYPTEKK